MVITRKLISFLRDPLGGFLFYGRIFAEGVRPRPYLEKGLIVWSKYQLHRNGLLTLLSNRPKSAYAPNYEDLWFLYSLVRQKKPRIILEFGAGCSTVILAQALYDNARESLEAVGRLYSVDAVHYWADVTR